MLTTNDARQYHSVVPVFSRHWFEEDNLPR